MAKKKINPNAAFILFNVIYEDGAQTSNRRVPTELVGGLDGEGPIKAFLEEQDRDIALKSGRPRGPIKTITRVPGQ